MAKGVGGGPCFQADPGHLLEITRDKSLFMTPPGVGGGPCFQADPGLLLEITRDYPLGIATRYNSGTVDETAS